MLISGRARIRAGEMTGYLTGSELRLQRELDRARAADLVQRIEAAALAAGAEPAIQRLGGIAELRRGDVVDRRTELRVIEDVEKIGARLQREACLRQGTKVATACMACGSAPRSLAGSWKSGAKSMRAARWN